MTEEYEERLQRAKKKLTEERARRKSKDGFNDDASYSSQMSKASRSSFVSEYSRSSSKVVDSTIVPRSEWRNKARAVIERGKALKEQEKTNGHLKNLIGISKRERTARFS